MYFCLYCKFKNIQDKGGGDLSLNKTLFILKPNFFCNSYNKMRLHGDVYDFQFSKGFGNSHKTIKSTIHNIRTQIHERLQDVLVRFFSFDLKRFKFYIYQNIHTYVVVSSRARNPYGFNGSRSSFDFRNFFGFYGEKYCNLDFNV